MTGSKDDKKKYAPESPSPASAGIACDAQTKVLLILGCGYSGQAIAKDFLNKAYQVFGTTRQIKKASGLTRLGIKALIYNGDPDEELQMALARCTHLVQSIAPSDEGDAMAQFLLVGKRNLPEPAKQALAHSLPRLENITYLSTTGVYGDHQGQWVNEETMPRPHKTRSRQRLQAEQTWTEIANQRQIPVQILRLAGIYGPGRNIIEKLREKKAQRIIKPEQVFNRVRVEDIARAVFFLAQQKIGGIFNITDDEPAPPQDLIVEGARLLGITPPPALNFEQAVLSPMAREFYLENKRASNAKIKSLGFEFLFPHYRQSLAQLVAIEFKPGN